MKNFIFAILLSFSFIYSQETERNLDSLSQIISAQIKKDIEVGKKLKKATDYEVLSKLIPVIGAGIILMNLDKDPENLKQFGFVTGGIGLGFYIAHVITMYDISLSLQGRLGLLSEVK